MLDVHPTILIEMTRQTAIEREQRAARSRRTRLPRLTSKQRRRRAFAARTGRDAPVYTASRL
jgi:hypothetical protein